MVHNRIPLFFLFFSFLLPAVISGTEINNNPKPTVVKVDTTLIESSKGLQDNGASTIIEFQLYFDTNKNLSDISSISVESPEGSNWTYSSKDFIEKYDKNSKTIVLDTLTSLKHKHYLPLPGQKLVNR